MDPEDVNTNKEDNKSTDVKKGNNISIKRSTFNKLVIAGVAILIAASFFAGYTLHGFQDAMNPITVVPQSQSLLTGLASLINNNGAISQSPVKIPKMSLDNAVFEGNVNAPVTLVEYGDFQCPFCERFFTDTLPQLQKTYIDTGKVKFGFEEYPLDTIHPNARAAALAAECANEQSKFWPYHDKLYMDHNQWGYLNATDVNKTFKNYAVRLGLDMPKFDLCFDSKKYDEKINIEALQASTYQVTGTPTFYVGNAKMGYTQIAGAQPFYALKQIIDQSFS